MNSLSRQSAALVSNSSVLQELRFRQDNPRPRGGGTVNSSQGLTATAADPAALPVFEDFQGREAPRRAHNPSSRVRG